MRFMLTEDQRALVEAVESYARDCYGRGVVRHAFDGDGFDEDYWSGAMALGLGGIMAPEDMGGLGLGMIELALVAEALGYGAAPGPFFGHVMAILALMSGDPHVAETVLPELVAGEAIGTVALGE